jgi:lipopolysaccharide export system protein LptA
MRLQLSLLRRWLALAIVLLGVVIVGVYVYTRHETRVVVQQIPGKIGLDIQQTAQGFTISKSDQGRTLFTIQANKAIQFKQGGAELHNVNILLYGRDSSRYDRIYGNDFTLDGQTGNVTARGEVLIDLEANPRGLLTPDQSVPTDLKNPIHLRTSNLVFNQKTGDAFTTAGIEFQMPQASGSAVGAHYEAKENVLVLQSQVHLIFAGASPVKVAATRAVFTKAPRQLVFDRPEIHEGPEQVQAEKAALFLRENNTVERILATGGVRGEVAGDAPAHLVAEQADLSVSESKLLESVVLTGDVQLNTEGDHPSRANAGRVTVDVAGRNVVGRIHAADGVKLVELPPRSSGNAETIEVSAPTIDFLVAGGRRLEHASTGGAAQITILPASSSTQRTVVTAGRFQAKFDEQGRLATLHGAPDAKIVSTNPGQSDRVSTSQTLDATFNATGGIESIVQQGNVAYSDSELHAWADRARYTPTDEMLVLNRSPRIAERGMITTATTMRMNHATGEAIAEGNVKTTYSDLREQPDGALLASSSPIHVTAAKMTARNGPSVARYTGNVRLWQDANVVEAPTIQFDRDHRSILAEGEEKLVSTVLVQVDKRGNATPVTITAARLTYTDDEHKAHFEGDVLAHGADATITAKQMDAFLLPRRQVSGAESLKGQGRLERMVAEGNVVVQEPSRRATGEKLVYTAAEDKFVLTGGSPSIFDAERGKITGVSLTFYKRDDRVLVEGRETSPAVTQTRVAR